MSLLILGSIAKDNIKTPITSGKDLPGGAAIYASVSASYFTNPQIVGVIGTDFNKKWLEDLERRNIDISGVKIKEGKTFRWSGEYKQFNKAITLNTELNVFEKFSPTLSENQKNADFVLLGNIDPEIQLDVLSQMKADSFIGMDTMNFWINSKADTLKKVIKKTNILFINDEELKLLANKDNIFQAVDELNNYFKGILVIKRGEFGSFLYFDGKYFFSPIYPVKNVFDTTGAGDSFAGAFMGFIQKQGEISFNNLKKALLYGSVLASYAIESFSIFKLMEININDIEERYKFLLDTISI